MKHSEIKEFLGICRTTNVVPYIWGNQGIGKSQLVAQYAKENNLDFIDFRVSLMEPGDLIGMPEIHGDRTVFRKPDWFPHEGTSGVLFLDELNRGETDILQASFQLILDKRINSHVLPEGWQIVCAGNFGEQFEVVDLDAALLDRFCHIKLDLVQSEWESWATENSMDEYLISVIKEHKMLLRDDESFDITNLKITTSPRSWDMINQLLKANISKKLMREASQGLLSLPDASTFMKVYYDKNFIHITPEDVFKANKTLIKKVVNDERVMELTANLNDKLIQSLAEIADNKKLNDEIVNNVLAYLMAIPVEQDYVFMKSLREKHVNTMTGFANIGDRKLHEKNHKRLTDYKKTLDKK